MKYPINLSNESQRLFLCRWNGNEIVEIHTIGSFWEQYKNTNVYDADFVELFDITIDDVFNTLEVEERNIFDNMEIRRIR